MLISEVLLGQAKKRLNANEVCAVAVGRAKIVLDRKMYEMYEKSVSRESMPKREKKREESDKAIDQKAKKCEICMDLQAFNTMRRVKKECIEERNCNLRVLNANRSSFMNCDYVFSSSSNEETQKGLRNNTTKHEGEELLEGELQDTEALSEGKHALIRGISFLIAAHMACLYRTNRLPSAFFKVITNIVRLLNSNSLADVSSLSCSAAFASNMNEETLLTHLLYFAFEDAEIETKEDEGKIKLIFKSLTKEEGATLFQLFMSAQDTKSLMVEEKQSNLENNSPLTALAFMCLIAHGGTLLCDFCDCATGLAVEAMSVKLNYLNIMLSKGQDVLADSVHTSKSNLKILLDNTKLKRGEFKDKQQEQKVQNSFLETFNVVGSLRNVVTQISLITNNFLNYISYTNSESPNHNLDEEDYCLRMSIYSSSYYTPPMNNLFFNINQSIELWKSRIGNLVNFIETDNYMANNFDNRYSEISEEDKEKRIEKQKKKEAMFEQIHNFVKKRKCENLNFVENSSNIFYIFHQFLFFQNLILLEIYLSKKVIETKEFQLLQNNANRKTNIKYNIGLGVERFKQFLSALVDERKKVVNYDVGGFQEYFLIKQVFSNFKLLFFKAQIENIIAPKNHSLRIPKVAKGCRDYDSAQMLIRKEILTAIEDVFFIHGAVQIDTPAFELKETLLGNYGEDQKLIFDLKDQGGEQLSLRFDLTVPFARFVASNSIEKIKRFHIGKVYRRDEPQMTRGRYREFYQCDFDIAGCYDSMITEAEILCILFEVLNRLKRVLGDFKVKLNHRALLDSAMLSCGVEESMFRTVCSSIDKLDKQSWLEVKHEMITLKNLNEEVADRIGDFVKLNGKPHEIIKKLEELDWLKRSSCAAKALDEIRQLMHYLKAFDVVDKIDLDMSLARGLDYYTGLIYEAVLVGKDVGSVAAGGRYDGLLSRFSNKNVPAVGVSFGVERIFRIVESMLGLHTNENDMLQNEEKTKEEEKNKNSKFEKKKTIFQKPHSSNVSEIRENTTDILVCSVGDNLLLERMKLCKLLWENRFNCEFMYYEKPKLKKQLDFASQKKIPLVLIIGEDEVLRGTVKVRSLAHGNELQDKSSDKEKEVEMSNLVHELNLFFQTKGKSFTKIRELLF